MRSLAYSQALFVLGMVLSCVVEAMAAYWWIGALGVEGVVYSSLFCLVPGCITILIVGVTREGGLAAYSILVGIGLRVIFVIAGLLAIKAFRHDLGFREFVVWLIVNYLVALALETWVVVRLSHESGGAV